MYATTTHSGAFDTMFITLIRSGYAETPARETMSRYRKSKTGVARVTTRSAHRTQLGGGRARPCRRVVLSGNTRPGRKPRRAHTHGVDRGKAPRATNTSCVTGRLLARVEGLEATLTPHPLITFVPLGPSENSPQTPSKDPRKTLLRLPQRALGRPSSDTLKGPTESPLLRAHWAHNPEDDRSFEYRLEKRRGEGCYVTPSRRPRVRGTK